MDRRAYTFPALTLALVLATIPLNAQGPFGKIKKAVDKAKQVTGTVTQPVSPAPNPPSPNQREKQTTSATESRTNPSESSQEGGRTVAPSASGQPNARGARPLPPRQYLFCYASEPAGPAVRALYYSADFVLIGADVRPTQDAFRAFLQQRYSFKGDAGQDQPVQCTGVQTEAEAKSVEQLYVERDQKNRGLKVVMTGWTNESSAAVGETAGPLAVPPPPASSATAPLASIGALSDAQSASLASLTPADRQFVLDEVPRSKSYCEQNAFLSGVIDCSCFARSIFLYRISHPEEKVKVLNARAARPPVFPPLVNVIGTKPVNCAECLPDEKLAKWASDDASILGVSPARARAYADCVGRETVKAFRSEPYVYFIGKSRNVAATVCTR
ncbi:MAG: hypothetical protein U0Q16_25130 [Bryobacteraceae bacterium]